MKKNTKIAMIIISIMAVIAVIVFLIAKGISVGEILWVTTLTVIVIAPIAAFFYDTKTALFLFAAFFLLWIAVLLGDIYLISKIGHQLGWCELADWAIW